MVQCHLLEIYLLHGWVLSHVCRGSPMLLWTLFLLLGGYAASPLLSTRQVRLSILPAVFPLVFLEFNVIAASVMDPSAKRRSAIES